MTDADVAFLVNVKDDLDGLDWVLSHLRAHYPLARVEVVGDGDGGAAGGTAGLYRCGYRTGPSLFPLARGGLIVQRTLDALLAGGDEPWLVKCDTDTGFYRRLRRAPGPPRAEAVYGTVQAVPTYAHFEGREGPQRLVSLQGGFVCFSRAAAARIADSRVCLDPDLADRPRETWAASPYVADSRVAKGLTSEDWVIGWALAQLGIPAKNYPEVHSLPPWGRPGHPGDRYAVTHPCKGRVLPRAAFQQE